MIAEVYGLVLAGGKSSRMGRDKGQLVWQGKTFIEHAISSIASTSLSHTFLSINKQQQERYSIPVLEDLFHEIGPMGALATFFTQYPRKACLVMACDLPLLTSLDLQHLIDHRNPNAEVTTYFLGSPKKPEPLCAIWEPSIWPKMEKAMLHKQYGLRRLLKEVELEWIAPLDPKRFANVNDPKGYSDLKNQHKGG